MNPEPAKPTRKRGSHAPFVVLALAVTVIVSIVGLIVLWLINPSKDTVAYEAAKGCIGILAVGAVGLVFSQAGGHFQHERDALTRAQAEDRDRRLRRDEVVRSLLSASLANYHVVKRARRLLKARLSATADAKRADLAVYDEYLAVISDAQLIFEQLRQTAVEMQDERIDAKDLASCYERIRIYINCVVDEYEKKRRHVAHSDPPPSLSELTTLASFLDRDAFAAHAAEPLHAAQRILETALLAQPEDGRHASAR